MNIITNKSVYGKKYEVINDDHYWFVEGDIVICLEDNVEDPYVINQNCYEIVFGYMNVHELSESYLKRAYKEDFVHAISMSNLKEVNDK